MLFSALGKTVGLEVLGISSQQIKKKNKKTSLQLIVEINSEVKNTIIAEN